MAITTAMASSFKQQIVQGQHNFTAGGTVTGTPTNSSPTVTSVSSVANLAPGMSITGTNIAASSVIATVDSSSQFTLSKNATGSPGSETLTYAADVFNLALYTSSATLGASTTAYSSSNEASGTGYVAGGSALTNNGASLSSTTALVDFADLTFSTATITARGSLIYNTRGGLNNAVITNDFGADKSSSSGNFTIVFPAVDSSNAIIRIA
jgi:hypothetical protein